jgi:uncharacterized protein YyaL (SSP411 family)
MDRLFWDEGSQAFYDTGIDHEALISRPRDVFDNATPSGTSVTADVLLRLAVVTGDFEFERKAVATLRALAPVLERAPTGFGRLLSALDFHLSRPQELAVIWAEDSVEASPLLDVALEAYRPNLIFAGAAQGQGAEVTPLLADRAALGGRATAYVCERFVCRAPTTDAAELRRQLNGET